MLPKVFFAASNIDYFAPSENILKIRKKESFKKGSNFNISDCHDFIDFFKKTRMILRVSVHKHSNTTQLQLQLTIRGCKGFDGGVEAR